MSTTLEKRQSKIRAASGQFVTNQKLSTQERIDLRKPHRVFNWNQKILEQKSESELEYMMSKPKFEIEQDSSDEDSPKRDTAKARLEALYGKFKDTKKDEESARQS